MTKIRFSEFEAFCREQLNLSRHSLRAYEQDLKSFNQFMMSAEIVDVPTTEDLIRYSRYLRDTVGASAATIRRRFVTLRSYYRWCEENCGGVVSPFRNLRLDLKVPKRLPRPVDRPTLNILFEYTKHLIELDPMEASDCRIHYSSDQITGLIIRLLVVTGMRVGEITNLRVGDVSSACSQIRVRGKGDRERTVFVTNKCLLGEFRRFWERRRQSASPDSFLFLNVRGGRLTEAAFRKRLRTISKSLAIEPHLTPHRFRHSAATLLIEEGVDIRLVQRLLGHASISTTEIYTKVSDNSLAMAIERADTLAQVDP